MSTSSQPDNRFVQAVTSNQLALTAYCRARLGNAEDAADVLQQLNVKLWEKHSDWDPETDFLPWAFSVARFTVLTFIRDASRDRLLFDQDVCELIVDETENAAGNAFGRHAALKECLKKVDVSNLEILKRHYIAGVPLKEIAEAAGRSHGAIKGLLFRIRRQLGPCIDSKLAIKGQAQ